MTEFKNFNREDVPPYFRYLISESYSSINHLRKCLTYCIEPGYLDPDSHEQVVRALKELRRLNDEIYALGRIDARHPMHLHGVPCPPMRGETAVIERLLRFTRNNPNSSGVLRFLAVADQSGEAE